LLTTNGGTERERDFSFAVHERGLLAGGGRRRLSRSGRAHGDLAGQQAAAYQ